MIAADDDKDSSEVELENGNGQHHQAVSTEQSAPLQNYFTLPFALHLRPLPHVSYLAQEDSADSSDADRHGGASSSSSSASNYRAGKHRLRPALQSAPPHPLSTISTLLERTGCLEAVPQWTKLLTMLEKADDDAHFTNLRQFFDARFDGEGRLVANKGKETLSEDEKDSGALWGSSALFGRRRPGSVARRRSRTQSGQSPKLGANEGSRRGSNASRSSNKPSAVRNRSHLGKSVSAEDQGPLSEQDEATSSVGDENKSLPSNMSPSRGYSQRRRMRGQSLQGALLTAPEINFAPRVANEGSQGRRRTGSIRPIRFRIRLDLHSVHLAPRPPRGTVTAPNSNVLIRTRSQRAAIRQHQGRMAGSPEKSVEMHRVASLGASSAPSLADSISLYPVVSPDSVRSQQMSEASHSDDYHRTRQAGEDVLASPPRKSTNQSYSSHWSHRDKSGGRTMTGSSAATNMTSLFGSSPEAGDEKRNAVSDNGKRRPSMIQRLLNFNGRKQSSSSRKRSTTNNTSQSNDEASPEANTGQFTETDRVPPMLRTTHLEGQDSTTMSSPLNMDPSQSRSFSMAMHSQDAQHLRIRSRTNEGSDWSNEEALDVADDEGSVASSGGWGKGPTNRRKSSSGVLPSNTAGLLPVHEERVFDSTSAFSGTHYDGQDIEEEDEDEAEWAGMDGFLTLLRLAAQTTLSLTASPPQFSTGASLSTPKSPSSANSGLQTPISSQEEQRLRAEELLAPFTKQGNEEHPDSWWLCGRADPLPVSFSCALSQAMGWQGIMDLCYGKDSLCSKSGTFSSLGKAAEMHGKLQEDSNKVRSWAQEVSQVGYDSVQGEGAPNGVLYQGEVDRASLPLKDEVAPSESASATKMADANAKPNKLSRWMRRMPGRGVVDDTDASLANAVPSLALNDQASSPTLEDRTWQDWADLFASIAAWVEEYESTRVRNGMAREVDREPSRAKAGDREEDVVYTSMASYQVPRSVVLDALDANHGFRRRHGIPEGLPMGLDGEEVGDYRWARKRLTSSHFATPLILASGSLSYYYGQLAASEWTYNSSWELDYLEMCVFHSDIISTRFPSPSTSIVPFDQVYQPPKDDVDAIKRAKTCPYPRDSTWHCSHWQHWLTTVQSGMILVPAVSWQAWWTLIAILNGADGSGRTLDLQVKAAEEPFSALDDMECFYI